MLKKYLFLLLCVLMVSGIFFQSGCLSGNQDKFTKFKSYVIGENIEVNLGFSDNMEAELSDRELKDQAKDWLLLGLLYNSGLTIEEINDITFDLPTVRYGYMEPVANFEYGATRSRYIGNGAIVALIPECTGKERIDYLAHIADEHRKNLDEIPQKMYVFQYKLDLDDYFSLVTRLDDQDARLLFTPKYGYYETQIRSLDDLKKLMSQIDDLTYAQLKDSNQLILGGRKIQSRKYGTITIEDVATIWQAEVKLEQKWKEFRGELAKLYRLIPEQKRKEFEEKIPLLAEKRGLKQSIGFSLDQVFDYDNIICLIEGRWDSYAKRVMTLCPGYFQNEDLSNVSWQKVEREKATLLFEGLLLSNGFDPKDVVKRLKDKDESVLYELLAKVKSVNPEMASFLLSLFKLSRYQRARYDGRLRGTEVGMHLFYTDLLAKLWTMNFNFSTPKKSIPYFINHTEADIPKVFEEEARCLCSVRLWFGPNEDEIQLSEDKEKILFSRNISEIFAKSPDDYSYRKEFEVAAIWKRSLNWWNTHYEEVAQFEPEYERLNQILKWSTVASWLHLRQRDHLLNFLRGYTVRREFWFSDWAKNKKGLKYNEWGKINFFPKNFNGHRTETMPLLFSPTFERWGQMKNIYGGVSTLSKNRINELPGLSKNLKEVLRRPGLKRKPIVGEPGGKINLNNLKKVNFEIDNTGKSYRLVTKTNNKVKFSSSSGELRSGEFGRELVLKANQSEILVSHEGVDIGSLSVKNTQNGFNVGFESRTLDKGYSISRKLSNCENIEKTLGRNPFVQGFEKIGSKNPKYLVDIKGSKKSMEIELFSNSELTLRPEKQFRVSGNSTGSKIIESRFVDRSPKGRMLSDPIDSSLGRLELGIEKISSAEFDKGLRIVNDVLSKSKNFRNGDFFSEVTRRLGKNSSIPKSFNECVFNHFEFFSQNKFKLIMAHIKNPIKGTRVFLKEILSRAGPKRVIIDAKNLRLNNIDFPSNPQKVLPKILETYPRSFFEKIPIESLKGYRFKFVGGGKPPLNKAYSFELGKSWRSAPFFPYDLISDICDDEEDKKEKEECLDVYILHVIEVDKIEQ